MEYRLARTNEETGYKIIKVYEENGKMYADCRRPCERCGGTGQLPYYGHIDRGRCFKCGGAKYFYKTFRAYTEEERAKLDEAYQKKQEKKKAELENASEPNRTAWLTKYGMEGGNLYIVVGANTYQIKDKLKDAGARYYQGLGWFFNDSTKPADDFLTDPYFFYHTTFDEMFTWNCYHKTAFFKDGAVTKMERKITEIKTEANKQTSNSQHYGVVGERIRKELAVYKEVRAINNDWGGSLLYTFAIGENIFTWFTQSVIDESIKPGDTIILSGTIKAHTEYNGILQTQLSRCIVKKQG